MTNQKWRRICAVESHRISSPRRRNRSVSYTCSSRQMHEWNQNMRLCYEYSLYFLLITGALIVIVSQRWHWPLPQFGKIIKIMNKLVISCVMRSSPQSVIAILNTCHTYFFRQRILISFAWHFSAMLIIHYLLVVKMSRTNDGIDCFRRKHHIFSTKLWKKKPQIVCTQVSHRICFRFLLILR